uniref:Uncharacterized protein n=1 Tax=Physcomitrium patens TaxID=3218 RepID=A0A2K1IFR8_PHYPA|nr:hypothetical protein PHYPA_028710 [Physcomitrium patens]
MELGVSKRGPIADGGMAELTRPPCRVELQRSPDPIKRQACRARQNQRSGITEQNATYAFGLVIVRVISTVKERGKNASLLWCRRVRLVWDPGRWANLSDRECVRKEVGLLWATLHKAVAVNAWRAELMHVLLDLDKATIYVLSMELDSIKGLHKEREDSLENLGTSTTTYSNTSEFDPGAT